jgi:hypothetical protein
MMRILAALVTLALLAFSGTAAAQEKWIEFSSPRYGFAVLFPKTPTESLDGTTYKFLATARSSAYIVSITELSAALDADDELFSALVQAYSAAGQLTIRTQRRLSFANTAGVELIADHKDKDIHHLAYLFPVGKRLYQVISAGPEGHETSADAYRFRDSFRLQ